ncbi:MAG: hypothetical protein RLY20_1387 [Verrucomicrobiota bacterium]|jgi:hypothetical protein
MNVTELSIQQLKKAVTLKQRIAKLEEELAAIIGASASAASGAKRRGFMSAAGRARIAAAQRKRWAKIKAAGAK